MNEVSLIRTPSELARKRLLAVKGDPFLRADWKRVIFMHFAVSPEVLRPYVAEPFELDLYEGQACVSLVALTMSRFRPFRRGSLAGWLFRPISRQSFLNVRTYVRCGDEPGALFLWGWLSKPFGVGLPMGRSGLPCGFCPVKYDHGYEAGILNGIVKTRTGLFNYHATIGPGTEFQP